MSTSEMGLGEQAVNIVENLASRIAERQSGKVRPHSLIPYLPMSLSLIRECLDNMADGTSVVAELEGNAPVYEFTKYSGRESTSGLLAPEQCVACSVDIHAMEGQVLCRECARHLNAELSRMADATGWPAQAVYEHEILYVAANTAPPLYTETLAGRSRYTIRRMLPKLNAMAAVGMIQQIIDEQRGVIEHVFPELSYPKSSYRANMAVICGYPASAAEEVEMKLVRILVVLAGMLFAALILGFLLVPFPLLLLAFVVAAPIVSLSIWRKRLKPADT